MPLLGEKKRRIVRSKGGPGPYRRRAANNDGNVVEDLYEGRAIQRRAICCAGRSCSLVRRIQRTERPAGSDPTSDPITSQS